MNRLTCEKCGKFLNCEAYGTVVGKFYCRDRKCKHVNIIKHIVLDDTHNLTVKMVSSEEES